MSNETVDTKPGSPKKGKLVSLGIIGVLLIGLFSFVAYSYSIVSNSTTALSNIFPDQDIFSMVGSYLGFDETTLKGENSGRTNFLLVGEDNDDKTDTIIVLSYFHSSKEFAALSLPRDVTVNDGVSVTKINAVYAQAQSRFNNGIGDIDGKEFLTQTVSDILDIPIHYTTFINIDGLSSIIDIIGGIEIDIQSSFTDCEFPTPNFQNVYYPDLDRRLPYLRPCPAFKKGKEVMDAERALIFARSRKSFDNPAEAIDFARNTRQQLVIEAILKTLSTQVKNGSLLFNGGKLQELSSAIGENIETTMNGDEFSSFARTLSQNSDIEIDRYSLDFSSGIICPNPNGSTFIILCDRTFITRKNPSKSQRQLQQIVKNLNNTAKLNEFFTQKVTILGNNSDVIEKTSKEFVDLGFSRTNVRTSYTFSQVPAATRNSIEKALIYIPNQEYKSLVTSSSFNTETIKGEFIDQIPNEFTLTDKQKTEIIVLVVDEGYQVGEQ